MRWLAGWIALAFAALVMAQADAGERGGRRGGGGWRRPHDVQQPPGPGADRRDGQEEKDREADREREKEERERREAAAREKAAADERERQPKRLERGIEKGSLSQDDLAALEAQQKAIAELEASFKEDGKLTREEFKAMQKTLDASSLCIWRDKNDGDRADCLYGKNVFANQAFLGRFNNEDLSRSDARALLKDFRSGLGMVCKLATAEMPQDERVKLQGQYNDFLNKYFENR